jgi:hypothetical protein
MRYLTAILFLACAACSATRDPRCELDLSAAGFVTELTHAQGTHRTPAFDDYTPGSYHVAMDTLLDAVRAERSREPRIRALVAVGPFGPLWQYNVALFLDEDDQLRSNILAMPHARITWKATGLVPRPTFDALSTVLESATTSETIGSETSVLFVRWTADGEAVRTSRASLYAEPPQPLQDALDRLRALGDVATTTYSNDLGDEIKMYRCSQR